MVSGRPLLYLSLPGVAFLLGVFWFRRRNRNRSNDDDGDGKTVNKEATATNKAIDEDIIQKTVANGIIQHQQQQQQPKKPNSNHNGTPARSKSMNINGTIPNDDRSDDTTTAATIFGKSAPISIVQNGKTSPIKQQESLHSIDEDSDVDLPGSLNHCVPLYSCNVNSKDNKPIVIKATRTPKISPENSFLESKYTKECEQNNNFELVLEQSQQTQLAATPQSNTDLRETTNDCDNSSPKQTNIDNELDANGNTKKRNVDAASPALSMCSVQSGDSGTGSSLPRSEANRNKMTYEFFFPDNLIGQLYGRKRTFINQLQTKTAASVSLRKNPCGKLRICKIEGTESEINAALAKIRQRLPIKRYPNFTMQRIHFALPQSIVPLSTESLLNLQLNLIEGINNDVVVSAVISGGHIFVQHPLHPSHPSLAVLQKCLYDSYTSAEAPLLPRVEISAVCVMPVNGIWYRVQIVEQDAEDEMRCIVKFLDFGGYMNVHFNELRQIRSDFMAVPFQATECLLSNIEPTEECWTPDAADILCKLTKGIVLQAQVAGYNSHNIPEIYLFAYLGPNNVIFINKELVARNLAKWVEVRD